MLKILSFAYAVKHEFGGKPDKLGLEKKLLIALNYWREYRTYAHLGVTYGYSESQICRIVCWCEDILINSGKFIVKGKRSLLSINPSNIVLIDATESPIQRPKKRQSAFYSGKKKRHTMKTQLVVNKTTREIICVHTSNVKTHDFKVLRDSKLPIKADTLVTTDSGYQGLQELHAKTELPKKKSKYKPLSRSVQKANYLLYVKRAFNAQVNGVVKVFKIITEKFI